MGSIVIDAVNHFFNPPHTHSQDSPDRLGQPQPQRRSASHTASHTPALQPRPSCTSPTHSSMSVTGNRAASSHVQSQVAPAYATDATLSQSQSHSQHHSQSRPSHTRQASGTPSAKLTDDDDASGRPSAGSDPRGSSPESASSASATSPAPSVETSESPSSQGRCVKIRDLAHIQSLADSNSDAFSDNGHAFRQKSGDQGPLYEISGMPIEHIIEMVAGLLTKITTANDMQHEHLHRQMPAPGSSAAMSPQTNSVLAFHGKNVPSITILSYLNRINKYCPTSYEVFISLLVYFDRMTEKVNSGPIQNLRELNQQAAERAASQQADGLRSPPSTQSMEGVSSSGTAPVQTATPPMSGEFEKQQYSTVPGTPHSKPRNLESPVASSIEADPLNLSQFFVVDSFNIHRLVIAGVTCASKFFSDIFYTNSRYAKVGGLPLPELNHLELQFLLLNDFRLSIPVEEMEAYGTMLVEFYAREVLFQRQAEARDSGKRSAPAVVAG